ncbi:MAG: twitching motility protein PilT, partial [Cyanobium sp.]
MDLQIEDLMIELVNGGGSDLHLASGQPPFGRFNGQLRPILQDMVLSEEQCNKLIFSLL